MRVPRLDSSRALGRDQRGGSLVEYLIVVGLIALVGLGGFRAFGAQSDAKVLAQAACVQSLACVEGAGTGSQGQAGTAAAALPIQGAAQLPPAGQGPPAAEEKGFLQSALDVGKGFVVDGLWGTVTGLWDVVTHPIDTLKGLGHVIAHPIDSAVAIKDAVVNAWEENPERLIGQGIFEVVTLPVAALKAAKAGKIGTVARVARAADKADDVADAAKVADRASDAAKVADKTSDAAKVVRQTTDDLDELYRQAAVAQQDLAKATDEIAASTNGRPVIPDELKRRERAEAKIQSDYGGDASRIVDLARSSIELTRIDDVYKALDKLGERYEIVRVKDRFQNPTPEGYRDILVNVKTPNGHVTEVQLHLDQVLKVKNGPGHALYEEIQTIQRTARDANRPLSADETRRLGELQEQSRALYDEAYRSAGGT